MRRSHPGPAVYAIMWSEGSSDTVAPIIIILSCRYSYDGCGLDGVACYTKRSPTATVVGYCRVSTIEIVPPGGGPPGRPRRRRVRTGNREPRWRRPGCAVPVWPRWRTASARAARRPSSVVAARCRSRACGAEGGRPYHLPARAAERPCALWGRWPAARWPRQR